MYIPSDLLEVFLCLAILHIDEPLTPLTREIRDDWELIAKGDHGEILFPSFDEYCDIPEGKAIVLGAFNSLLARLKSAPLRIQNKMVQELIPEDALISTSNIDRLIELGEDFVRFANGLPPLKFL